MTSFSVSNKPFITSMLLDEVQVLLFDFATSINGKSQSICTPTPSQANSRARK